jgi:hypothetical protein
MDNSNSKCKQKSVKGKKGTKLVLISLCHVTFYFAVPHFASIFKKIRSIFIVNSFGARNAKSLIRNSIFHVPF